MTSTVPFPDKPQESPSSTSCTQAAEQSDMNSDLLTEQTASANEVPFIERCETKPNGGIDPHRDSAPVTVSRKHRRGFADPGNEWLFRSPDGLDSIDMRRESEKIITGFVSSFCKDVVFELHRELHTGILTAERLWTEHFYPPASPKPGGDVYGRIPPKEPSFSITCPVCGRSVGASRYAPHLDKCVLGCSRARGSRARSSPPPPDSFKSIDTTSSLKLPTARAYGGGARRASSPPHPRSVPASSLSGQVEKPIVNKRQTPLHILIKLVDGMPVQTYHRILLTPNKGEAGSGKHHLHPRSSPPPVSNGQSKESNRMPLPPTASEAGGHVASSSRDVQNDSHGQNAPQTPAAAEAPGPSPSPPNRETQPDPAQRYLHNMVLGRASSSSKHHLEGDISQGVWAKRTYCASVGTAKRGPVQ